MKEKEDLKKEIEAVLFAAGRKVSTEEIARLCKSDVAEVSAALKELKQDYNEKDSPLLLTEESDGYKLTVKEKYIPIVKEVTPHTELNRAMMSTLAIIAWKQPVLQSEVIKSRTSTAYDDIRNLVEMGFISKEKHGRSFILKPTGKFFEYFDLPSKEAVKEVFKDVKDVEPEVQEKLDAAKEAGEEHLGKLDVYEAPEKKEEGEEEHTENLGKLEVFTEEEKEETSNEENAEESVEPEELAEEPEEKTDEEKARDMIHKLAEEDEEDKKDSEESDEDAGDESEEPAEEGSEEAEESEEGPKEEKKSRLPKELEDFAGNGEEEKEESDEEQEKED